MGPTGYSPTNSHSGRTPGRGVREARQIPGDTNPEASAGPQSRSLRVVAFKAAKHGRSIAPWAARVIPRKGAALHPTVKRIPNSDQRPWIAPGHPAEARSPYFRPALPHDAIENAVGHGQEP